MHNDVKIWRIIDVIKESEKALKEKNISSARLNAELLLCDTLNTKRINLYLDFEKPLSPIELKKYKENLIRRLNFEPLQYIIGYTEFYGLRFLIKPGVLIPRQETELLVERALFLIESIKHKPRILEVGTGSGCISISIASKIDCNIDAIDVQSEAIELAKNNSNILGTAKNINFQLKDIFNCDINLKHYEMIICNPPYIPLQEFEKLPDEIKKYEPKTALTDGKMGLEFYKHIFKLICEQNFNYPVLLEIGDGKRSNIIDLLLGYGIKNFRFQQDYLHVDRVLEINPI